MYRIRVSTGIGLRWCLRSQSSMSFDRPGRPAYPAKFLKGLHDGFIDMSMISIGLISPSGRIFPVERIAVLA